MQPKTATASLSKVPAVHEVGHAPYPPSLHKSVPVDSTFAAHSLFAILSCISAGVPAHMALDRSADSNASSMGGAGRPPDRRPKADWHAPEERLMSALIAEHEASGGETLHSFVRRWRELFVATLSPRFMPPGWRTDHRCNTERDRSF